ncbi:hypothetical protein POM88_019413 [Heracleum sosnowskyi]|uniref:Uncharacterized protein n=1 Tax=Heracleum sosnowskyi TaxID=360622 RepID=A0AAD8MRW6_9APIA|nr:hypothetical protein POM88_019413 [Heracleum sosnowskyi]
MANSNPNYPQNYTFLVQTLGFTAQLPRFYRSLEDRLTQPITFANNAQGKQLIQSDDPSGFLVFIRYVMLNGTVVTVLHRNFDLAVVGRQTGDGIAYVLNNSFLEKTKGCLEFYKIRYEVIRDLEELSLESFAQRRKARVSVGALGLDVALAAFGSDDANADLRSTAFGFLYFDLLVSLAFRVGCIRRRVVKGFSGFGVEIPEEELQLEYAWRAVSYVLSPEHFSSVDHFDEYTLTDVRGRVMSSIELGDCFLVIEQTGNSEEISLHTDMGGLYAQTVQSFYQEVQINYPKA